MSKQQFSTIIIGSGFGGQCAAIRLKAQGNEDFVILERRDFFGGTWSQNEYPGAAVDVPSPLYSISNAPYDWSEMFAKRDELWAYTQHVMDKFDLHAKLRLGHQVSELVWHDTEKHWEVRLEGKEPLYAQFVIAATGLLSNPTIPDFVGKDKFKGKSFHTNMWDHSYDHKGKRVAIIGSAASAIQVIPTIAPEVGQLHVFQRTAHWVLPRPDRVFTATQRRWLKNSLIYKALRYSIYWGLESRILGFKYSQTLMDRVVGRQALAHLRRQVKDPVLREKLTPDYTIGCKRILLSNTLYPAYCRENVSLHDKNSGIQEITETGIITTDGKKIDVDLIVYATGFAIVEGALACTVRGRDGRTIEDFWREYPRTYLGTTAPGFPNLFVMAGPNTGIGHTSLVFMLEAQMNYIMDSMTQSAARQAKAVEVTAAAEADYTAHIHSEMKGTVWAAGGCKSWYQTDSGRVVAIYPGFSFSFYYATKYFKPQHHLFS